MVFGWLLKRSPRSLLDNTPLRELLEQKLNFRNIGRSIDRGSLYAVSLTASGYTSGQSVSFFQAGADVESWERTHRFSCRAQLNICLLYTSRCV